MIGRRVKYKIYRFDLFDNKFYTIYHIYYQDPLIRIYDVFAVNPKLCHMNIECRGGSSIEQAVRTKFT